MPYLAISHTGAEIIFRNKPKLKDNEFLSYSGEAIKLPDGSIKKLTGKELKFGDEPLELTSDESTANKPRPEQGERDRLPG